MARRKARRRYYPRARKAVSRSRGLGAGGVIGSVVDGVLTGAIQNVVPAGALGGFAHPLVPIAIGWFRKNKTLQTIGGYQLGLKLASGMGAGNGSGLGLIGQ